MCLLFIVLYGDKKRVLITYLFAYAQGIDSGEYSRTLMNSAHSVLGTVTKKEDTVPTPLELLTYAHGKAKVRL